MKALVWTKENMVEVQERELPNYDGKILVKIAYAGICGSDVSVYLGKHPRAKTPLIMGHEFSGVVEAIGSNVKTTLQIGDSVVVNPLYSCGTCRACMQGNSHVCRTLRLYGTDTDGGMAEYAALPESCVYPVPKDLSLKLAAVVEPVAVVVHGLRMVKKDFFTTACVTGMGPMGLLTALMLKDAGVQKLFTVEANEKRAQYARDMGLEVINPLEVDCVQYILDRTNGEGVSLLVEASGSPAVAKIMTDLAGVRAEILLLSVFKEPVAVDLRAVNFKEQFVIGTRVYTRMDVLDAITYITQNSERIESIVSHVFPIEEGQAAFQEIVNGQTNMMKVLFEM